MPTCHSERSEESMRFVYRTEWILRCAQNDRQWELNAPRYDSRLVVRGIRFSRQVK
jgi:hypothetical protein